MAWLECTVKTTGESVENVGAQLTALGFADFVIEDETEFESFLEENRAYWDYIDESLEKKLHGLSQIQLYLPREDAGAMERLKAFCDGSGLPLTVTELAETDWSESWKENYPPQEVGKNLIVLPYWLENPGTRTPVILDPGLTFGTGAHPSTQMVLETMEELVQPGFRCLDLGSGSGILSIAALRLGAAEAVGVDIDPKAEAIARENAGYNGFAAPAFTALTGNVTQDKALMEQLKARHWDMVFVNIVADVILALAPVLPAFLGQETRVILSGILDTRLEEVLAALKNAGLTPLSVKAKEDWRCVLAKR